MVQVEWRTGHLLLVEYQTKLQRLSFLTNTSEVDTEALDMTERHTVSPKGPKTSGRFFCNDICNGLFVQAYPRMMTFTRTNFSKFRAKLLPERAGSLQQQQQQQTPTVLWEGSPAQPLCYTVQ
jgi:hypothetical protein